MSSCRMISFKDVQILYTDLSYSSAQECIEIIQQNREIIKAQPVKSVLSLINLKKMQVSTPLFFEARESMIRNTPHVLATAVIGLTPFTRMIMDTIMALTGRDIAVLDNLEGAKLWLVDRHRKKINKENLVQ